MGGRIGGGRRYARGFAVGALLAGLVFAWMVTDGTFDPGHRVPFSGNFYDVQAHQILAGNLSMPRDVLSIEGYEHDGNWYMYFGPAPALLRLPTAAVTDSLDGRTGVASMLFAFTVLMVAFGHISWRLRRWVRGGPLGGDPAGTDAAASDGASDAAFDAAGEEAGDSRVDALDEALAGVTAFVLGAGTTAVFLGVGAYVYHEAILWGVALSFAAFAAILAWIETTRPRLLLAAGVLTLLALSSRLAVGIAPAATLLLLAVVFAIARIWPRARRLTGHLGLDEQGIAWRTVGWLAAAAAVPLGVYALVNLAKFGTLFSVPYDHQAANALVPGRRAMLASNGGTLVNVKALPTNLWQYLRPDAFRLRGTWPWVRLPSWRPHVFGGLRYDMLDHTSSVTAAMPVLVVLAITGVVAVFRAAARATGRRATATLRSLAVPVSGAAGAAVPTLVFVYITERYTADFLPVLVLPALGGFAVFLRWARAPGSRRGRVVAASVGLGALALWSCVANVSIARDYQLGREQVQTFQQSR